MLKSITRVFQNNSTFQIFSKYKFRAILKTSQLERLKIPLSDTKLLGHQKVQLTAEIKHHKCMSTMRIKYTDGQDLRKVKMIRKYQNHKPKSYRDKYK